ncbi:MAG: cupin domain-containing protein [Dehalococcoidia bacterium]
MPQNSDTPVNLAAKLALFSDHWSPKIVATMNDYELKVVKLQGEFTWHHHADTDEVFIVLSGAMDIELRDRTVTLRAGELFVVPKGAEHHPVAREECHVLLIEPAGVINTGEAGGELTAARGQWI